MRTSIPAGVGALALLCAVLDDSAALDWFTFPACPGGSVARLYEWCLGLRGWELDGRATAFPFSSAFSSLSTPPLPPLCACWRGCVVAGGDLGPNLVSALWFPSSFASATIVDN